MDLAGVELSKIRGGKKEKTDGAIAFAADAVCRFWTNKVFDKLMRVCNVYGK